MCIPFHISWLRKYTFQCVYIQGVSKKGVRKILHDIVIVGSIQSTSQWTYYEVQLYIVHLILKSELVFKVC